MSARRSGAGVGVLHGLLYSVGGHDGPLVRKSVEMYNSETNKWSPVADMNYCRRNAGVISHNGVLYVIGRDRNRISYVKKEGFNVNFSD